MSRNSDSSEICGNNQSTKVGCKATNKFEEDSALELKERMAWGDDEQETALPRAPRLWEREFWLQGP